MRSKADEMASLIQPTVQKRKIRGKIQTKTEQRRRNGTGNSPWWQSGRICERGRF